MFEVKCLWKGFSNSHLKFIKNQLEISPRICQPKELRETSALEVLLGRRGLEMHLANPKA